MTENATDGPRSIRVREGKKGPGKRIAVATNQAEADKIAAVLKADNDKVEVVITAYETPEIVTCDEFEKATAETRAAAIARQAVIDGIDPEALKVLKEMGLKV